MEQIVIVNNLIKGQRYNFRFLSGQVYNSEFAGYIVVDEQQHLLVINTCLEKALSYPKGFLGCPIRFTIEDTEKIYVYGVPTFPPDVNLLINDYVGYNGRYVGYNGRKQIK